MPICMCIYIIKEGEMATVCEKPVQVRSFMCSKPPESSFPFAHRVPIQTNDINMMWRWARWYWVCHVQAEHGHFCVWWVYFGVEVCCSGIGWGLLFKLFKWIYPASRMSCAQRTCQEYIQIKHLLWMMMLIFWILSLDASSFSWMLGQIVERIFVNCLSLICTRGHPTWRSSMVCLAMHLFDLSLRMSQVYVPLGSNPTQDGPNDFQRLRRLTTLWAGRSNGFGKGVSNCTTNITFWADAAGKSSDVGFSSSHKDSKKRKNN